MHGKSLQYIMYQYDQLSDNNLFWLIKYTDTADDDDLTVTKTLDGCIDAACLQIQDGDPRVDFYRHGSTSTKTRVNAVTYAKKQQADEKYNYRRNSTNAFELIHQDLNTINVNAEKFLQGGRNPLHHVSMNDVSSQRSMKSYLKNAVNKQKMLNPRMFFRAFEKVMKGLKRSCDKQLKYVLSVYSFFVCEMRHNFVAKTRVFILRLWCKAAKPLIYCPS